mmetsp:Transcript_30678/g.70222  ORF Transcript_30678/g.70222 Transcript_30678/m.70222 type:complete len:596 (+) Transcript_30678:3443-5230(+)
MFLRKQFGGNADAIVRSTPGQIFDEAFNLSKALKGEWGAIAKLDPNLANAFDLLSKIKCVGAPPLSPKLGVLREADGRAYSWHQSIAPSPSPAASGNMLVEANIATPSPLKRMEWKPRVNSLLLTSAPHEHSGPISRLAVSQDQSYFCSAGYDGSTRIWELRKIESGIDLRSSVTYSEHPKGTRMNDVCIIENSHSVATAGSDGSVHVFRVEVSSSSSPSNDLGNKVTESSSPASSNYYRTSRAVGSSVIRKINLEEGEVMAVSHFNTDHSSTILFATQHGNIHSWDLRCAAEPFKMKLRPELGYITTLACGNDRNWCVCGTSLGYIALWDIRFQLLLKLWKHESNLPVSRLATSFTRLPQDNNTDTSHKPYIFAGCGMNEASIFDLTDGACRQCFRTINDAQYYFRDQKDLPDSQKSIPSLRTVELGAGRHGHDCRMLHASEVVRNIYSQNSTRATLGSGVKGLMGRISTDGGPSYLITGGSDRCIRYWDFQYPEKCYTISSGGQIPSGNFSHRQPIYEKVDNGIDQTNLFLCRNPPPLDNHAQSHLSASENSNAFFYPSNGGHRDTILDLKSVDYPMKGLLSCSRNGVIKLWR